MRSMTDNEFLNIKQAADFLNVSETSLRRWTNSGSLPCLRVGAKRERRFRRTDLLAFMDRENSDSTPIRVPDAGEIFLEGVKIDPGTSLCTIYRSEAGQVRLSAPFIAEGLAAGHACFLLAPPRSKERIEVRIRQLYPELGREMDGGLYHASSGSAAIAAMLDELEDGLVTAMHQGVSMIRLVGDMTWHREHGLNDDDMLAFEAQLGRMLSRKFPAVVLCQYDARAFSGVTLLDAMEHHRTTFLGPKLNAFD